VLVDLCWEKDCLVKPKVDAAGVLLGEFLQGTAGDKVVRYHSRKGVHCGEMLCHSNIQQIALKINHET
jgi:hypothetical protein